MTTKNAIVFIRRGGFTHIYVTQQICSKTRPPTPLATLNNLTLKRKLTTKNAIVYALN
ncbi:MAG: hypothetical protein ACRCT1_14745 [Microcoleaceae cyanobacterium]